MDDAFHHGRKLCLIFGADTLELQADTDAREDITYNGLAGNAAIFDEEAKLDSGVDRQRRLSLDKDAADTNIANA